MRVCVVAELYPRPDDPVLGVWAHRQALAARDAGARRAGARARPPDPAAVGRAARSGRGDRQGARRAPAPGARRARRDPGRVRRLRLPRRASRSYARWHRWARRPLARALERAQPFDLVHAHYALPAGGAALPLDLASATCRWWCRCTAATCSRRSSPRRARARERGARAARERRASWPTAPRRCGVPRSSPDATDHMRVVHLGADAPPTAPQKHAHPTVATLGHVIPRKRHEDVLRAVAAEPGAPLGRDRGRSRAAAAARAGGRARRGGPRHVRRPARPGRRACASSRAAT